MQIHLRWTMRSGKPSYSDGIIKSWGVAMHTIPQHEFEDLLRRMLNAAPIRCEHVNPEPKKPWKLLPALKKDDLANGRTKLT